MWWWGMLIVIPLYERYCSLFFEHPIPVFKYASSSLSILIFSLKKSRLSFDKLNEIQLQDLESSHNTTYGNFKIWYLSFWFGAMTAGLREFAWSGELEIASNWLINVDDCLILRSSIVFTLVQIPLTLKFSFELFTLVLWSRLSTIKIKKINAKAK